ncbi:hypothetical protein NQ318_023095 [Aromia moschata]|uniref:Uncharacterized protein n=1 Tax=Aromia moschata TaxID=1265417 RepID=A0AAV8X354_9CUCU|nr:hypothetical protein NQ318_023095 [Aromia moschata]
MNFTFKPTEIFGDLTCQECIPAKQVFGTEIPLEYEYIIPVIIKFWISRRGVIDLLVGAPF